MNTKNCDTKLIKLLEELIEQVKIQNELKILELQESDPHTPRVEVLQQKTFTY